MRYRFILLLAAVGVALAAHAAEPNPVDAALDARIEQLHCSHDDAARLRQEQLFWWGQHNDCSNFGHVTTCEQSAVAGRLKYIASVMRCSGNPKYYPFADPWYILRHPLVYNNAPVNVRGSVLPSSCSPSSTSLAGKLQQYGSLPVLFKSLPPAEREFLCDKNPSSWWDGKIWLIDRKPTLYLTDILGAALP